jgi:hypothetical protein
MPSPRSSVRDGATLPSTASTSQSRSRTCRTRHSTRCWSHAFERYYDDQRPVRHTRRAASRTSWRSCRKAIGVDELGCLIDFGVDSATGLVPAPAEVPANQLRQLSHADRRDEDQAVAEDDVLHRGAAGRASSASRTCSARRHGAHAADGRRGRADALGGCSAGHGRRRGAAAQRWREGAPNAADRARTIDEHVRPHGDHHLVGGPRPDTVDPSGSRVTIGRPICRHAAIYVLDEARAAGAAGRARRAGGSAAAGRDARLPAPRPELTAERFLAAPVPRAASRARACTAPATWLRFRDDGRLEFLGRVDHQVKVRGYRIELGEIEAALAGAPPRCATPWWHAREDTPGDVRLVGYLSRSAGQTIEQGALREQLRERLPDFMVPAFVVHRRHAAHAQRQDRPQGAAGTRGERSSPPRRTTPRRRPGHENELAARRSPRCGCEVLGLPAVGARGELLRPRRALAPRRAGSTARLKRAHRSSRSR